MHFRNAAVVVWNTYEQSPLFIGTHEQGEQRTVPHGCVSRSSRLNSVHYIFGCG